MNGLAGRPDERVPDFLKRMMFSRGLRPGRCAGAAPLCARHQPTRNKSVMSYRLLLRVVQKRQH